MALERALAVDVGQVDDGAAAGAQVRRRGFSTDVLLLAEVYAAGEAPIASADGRALAEAVRGGARSGRPEPVFVEDIAGMPDAIRRAARAGDVVLTMGAGSIGNVAPQLS